MKRWLLGGLREIANAFTGCRPLEWECWVPAAPALHLNQVSSHNLLTFCWDLTQKPSTAHKVSVKIQIKSKNEQMAALWFVRSLLWSRIIIKSAFPLIPLTVQARAAPRRAAAHGTPACSRVRCDAPAEIGVLTSPLFLFIAFFLSFLSRLVWFYRLFLLLFLKSPCSQGDEQILP